MTDHPSQPLMSHLEELRNRLIKTAVAVAAGAIVAFIFRHWIFDLIVAPYEDVVGDADLVFFRPTEAFSLFMRLSMFGGFVLASPIVIWQTWAFIAPALTRREKRVVVPIVSVLVLLFLAGLFVGYLSLGRGLAFLIEFGGDDLTPVIGGNDYLSFAMRFLLVFALSFEFPVFLYSAAMIGVLGWQKLAAGRRWAVLLIVIVGAVITPSGDPLTLLLLSVPLYLLYEATIWIVRFTIRR